MATLQVSNIKLDCVSSESFRFHLRKYNSPCELVMCSLGLGNSNKCFTWSIGRSPKTEIKTENFGFSCCTVYRGCILFTELVRKCPQKTTSGGNFQSAQARGYAYSHYHLAFGPDPWFKCKLSTILQQDFPSLSLFLTSRSRWKVRTNPLPLLPPPPFSYFGILTSAVNKIQKESDDHQTLPFNSRLSFCSQILRW